MRESPQVSDVRFAAAAEDHVDRGMLGYISLVLDDAVRLDGLTLRRGQDGNRLLSFPSRVDRRGVRHAFVRPVGDRVRSGHQSFG